MLSTAVSRASRAAVVLARRTLASAGRGVVDLEAELLSNFGDTSARSPTQPWGSEGGALSRGGSIGARFENKLERSTNSASRIRGGALGRGGEAARFSTRLRRGANGREIEVVLEELKRGPVRQNIVHYAAAFHRCVSRLCWE